MDQLKSNVVEDEQFKIPSVDASGNLKKGLFVCYEIENASLKEKFNQ